MPRPSSSGQAAKRPVVPASGRDGSPSGPIYLWKPLAIGLSLLLPFATASAADPSPATGAKIEESRVANTYYVDSSGADAADDDKHGTQDSPFLTIKHAVDAAVRDKDANVGAKIVIASGTYRESITIPEPAGHKADTDAPLVIEATEHEQTIIDAADTAGWEAATWTTDGATLVHRWPFPTANNPRPSTGSAAAPAADSRRRAALFFNGLALRQVDAAAALAPGSFWIAAETDRRNPAATVRAQLPEGASLNEGVFQVGVRACGLEILGRRNVVVRGLLLQHAANPTGAGNLPTGLLLEGCANVVVEDVLSQWNDGLGLRLDGRRAPPWSAGFTLRRVRLIHNGGSGLFATNLKNLLAEDCETSFNAVRNEHTGVADAGGPAGVRAAGVHGSTWRRQRGVANFCRGLWWAGDCTDLLVEDAVVRDNLFSGLFVENDPGPSVVRGCFVSGNKLLAGVKPEASQPAAVSVEASPDLTLENNVVAGNFVPQLGLRDVAERADGVNFETGAKTLLRAERHAYHHNAFWGADAGQVLVDLPVADRTGKGDFAFYYGTLDSDENCFWNPALAEAFCTYDRTVYRRPGMTMAGWKTFLMAHAGAGSGGQTDHRPEAGSLWQDPLFMEPGEGDYRLQAQSPLIDWGLPSDEGAVAQ